MNLHIIAVGKKKSEYDTFIHEYQKRITAPYTLSLEIIDPAGIDDRTLSRTKESEKIIGRIKPTDFIITLDEHGKDVTTIGLAERIHQELQRGTKRMVFIIGGSYGFDETVTSRAHLSIRIGSMTLPHELVRLMITEQLYRTTNYLSGGKYHHA